MQWRVLTLATGPVHGFFMILASKRNILNYLKYSVNILQFSTTVLYYFSN